MNVNDVYIYNFEEIRRRSIKVWKAIPQHLLNWKPDEEALTCGEMIRHLTEGEYLYYQMLLSGGSHGLKDLVNPFDEKEFTTVEEELLFIQSYREEFIQFIKTLNQKDLEKKIDRSNVGYVRTLGDMLLRIAYHESVHTGQLLDYMRTMGIERPMIWD